MKLLKKHIDDIKNFMIEKKELPFYLSLLSSALVENEYACLTLFESPYLISNEKEYEIYAYPTKLSEKSPSGNNSISIILNEYAFKYKLLDQVKIIRSIRINPNIISHPIKKILGRVECVKVNDKLISFQENHQVVNELNQYYASFFKDLIANTKTVDKYDMMYI